VPCRTKPDPAKARRVARPVAEEIRLDVVARGHSKGLDDTSRALRGVKGETDKLGSSLDRTTKETFDFDRAVAEAREEITKLHEEVRRTGDRALLGDLKRQQRELADFMRLAGNAGKAGQSAFDFGGEGLRPRNALILSLVSAVAAAAPGIGAMIAGAVAGAVGTAGLGAGILSAAKSADVKIAAKEFGAAISTEFFRGGANFVQPTIAAMAELQDAFMDMRVPESLAKLAPLTDEIARGFGDAGRNFMPGFNRALDRMGPFAAVAEDGIGQLGDALGDFANMTTESEGALTGLDLLFRTVNGTIRLFGAGLKVASDITDTFASANASAFGSFSGLMRGVGFDALADGASKLSTIWLDIGKDIPTDKMFKVGEAIQTTNGAVQIAAGYWDAYAAKIQAVNDAISEHLDMNLQQDNANLRLQDAMLDLQESLKENGKHWETNTEKGLANRRALLDAVAAANEKRKSDIKSGVDADIANAAYERTIRKLERMAIKAGITGKALDDLIGDYKINILIRTKGSIPQHTSDFGGELFPDKRRRAAGGPVGPGPYLVGERGPEVLMMGSGHRGHVYPSVGAFRGATGGGGGGGSARPFAPVITDPWLQKAFDAIVREVGNRGGTLAVLGIRS
jgi:hypothetical protein